MGSSLRDGRKPGDDDPGTRIPAPDISIKHANFVLTNRKEKNSVDVCCIAAADVILFLSFFYYPREETGSRSSQPPSTGDTGRGGGHEPL